MKRFSYTIKEEQGIHARPASFLIQEARTYESRITIRVKGKEADASNIIAVMALDVVCGQRVEVEICGTDVYKRQILIRPPPSDCPISSSVLPETPFK